ncbi:hypothetical protein GCM10020254_75760 [Streptomyces goshikiensis]
MVLVDDGLVRPEPRGELPPGLLLDHHRAGAVPVDGVLLVHGARVLGDRVQQAPQAGEGLPVDGVGVTGGDHVGAGGVDRGMDHEPGPVDRAPAVADRPLVVDEDQVADPDVPEGHAERVDPEHVRVLRVPHGDVSRDPFGETEPAEDAAGAREPLLAVLALLRRVLEHRRQGQFEVLLPRDEGAPAHRVRRPPRRPPGRRPPPAAPC